MYRETVYTARASPGVSGGRTITLLAQLFKCSCSPKSISGFGHRYEAVLNISMSSGANNLDDRSQRRGMEIEGDLPGLLYTGILAVTHINTL